MTFTEAVCRLKKCPHQELWLYTSPYDSAQNIDDPATWTLVTIELPGGRTVARQTGDADEWNLCPHYMQPDYPDPLWDPDDRVELTGEFCRDTKRKIAAFKVER